MIRSPMKEDATYGSAPNLSCELDKTRADSVNITQRLKRRRCECGGESAEESKIDKFINEITLWRNESDSKLSDIQNSMQDIIKQNTDIIITQGEIEKSIQFLSEKYEDILQQLSSHQSKTQALADRVSIVEDTTEEIDRRSRSSMLELRNIRLPNKSPSQDEQLKVAVRVFQELSVDITVADIYDIRRTPSKSDGFTLICTLNSAVKQNKALRAYKDYNKRNINTKLNSTIVGGPLLPIYIGEHLTPRARRLFYLAREHAKAECYKHCWTAGGRVLLRKADNTKLIVVTSESQLAAPGPKN
ncbi:uncharacterized protein LOC106136428 [Amyelois transitella]|uniref:uncharacterized protein LOC106136428 n=1 Tax=Amyelois transitella TaxID=680683 RepID=UPI00067CDEC8|nr:uncharacterized protein LOC106136428 [Amyelois transitella]